MSTHDVLSYAIASRAVTQIRAADPLWSSVFSVDTHITTSRDWPMPDAVLRDDGNKISAAIEFKPPEQTKREYLTGLGQTLAYARDFHYSILVLPTLADDGYPIADHIASVLTMPEMEQLPIGLISYDASIISPINADYKIQRPLVTRAAQPPERRDLRATFYAKWREATPTEVARYLVLLFDESLNPTGPLGPKRDAFNRFWTEVQAGRFQNWAGAPRRATDTPKNKIT